MDFKDIVTGYTELPIKNSFSPGKVYFMESTTSTMDDARVFATRGAAHGTVVCAGFQTRGRGRFRERKWEAGVGESLLFTILLKKNSIHFPSGTLPVMTGLALALFCEDYFGFSPLIKWPNDLLYNSKKIAGILCEGDNEHLYCGMGINCTQAAFPGNLIDKAISLSHIIGRGLCPMEIIEPILFTLWKVFSRPWQEKTEWHKEVTKRLYRLGDTIRIVRNEKKVKSISRTRVNSVRENGVDVNGEIDTRGKQGEVSKEDGIKRNVVIEGVLAGVDSDGALLVLEHTSGRPRRIISGEVEFLEKEGAKG